MKEIQEEDIKPCPFCGSKGIITTVHFEDGDTWYNPQCEREGCCIWGNNFETVEEAIEAWNDRKTR